MKERIIEFLKILLSLTKIADSKKKDEMMIYKFNIQKYKFSIFCVYSSSTINIWCGNNFNVFVFLFKDGEFGEGEIKEGEKFFNIIHLPPDLVINELNKIGVKEL